MAQRQNAPKDAAEVPDRGFDKTSAIAHPGVDYWQCAKYTAGLAGLGFAAYATWQLFGAAKVASSALDSVGISPFRSGNHETCCGRDACAQEFRPPIGAPALIKHVEEALLDPYERDPKDPLRKDFGIQMQFPYAIVGEYHLDPDCVTVKNHDWNNIADLQFAEGADGSMIDLNADIYLAVDYAIASYAQIVARSLTRELNSVDQENLIYIREQLRPFVGDLPGPRSDPARWSEFFLQSAHKGVHGLSFPVTRADALDAVTELGEIAGEIMAKRDQAMVTTVVDEILRFIKTKGFFPKTLIMPGVAHDAALVEGLARAERRFARALRKARWG